MTICWKRAFVTKKLAKRKRKQYETKYWKKLKIYRCKECNTYHLTTQTDVDNKVFFREYYVKPNKSWFK